MKREAARRQPCPLPFRQHSPCPHREVVLLRAANTPVGGVDANRQAEGKAVPPALSLRRQDGEIVPDIQIDCPADDVAAQKRRIAARCERDVSGGGDGGIRQCFVIALRLADIEADRGRGELQPERRRLVLGVVDKRRHEVIAAGRQLGNLALVPPSRTLLIARLPLRRTGPPPYGDPFGMLGMLSLLATAGVDACRP